MKSLTVIFFLSLANSTIFCQTPTTIIEVTNGHKGNSYFICGSKPCNGSEVVEISPNGNNKIEGRFNKGFPKGTMNYYSENGMMSEE